MALNGDRKCVSLSKVVPVSVFLCWGGGGWRDDNKFTVEFSRVALTYVIIYASSYNFCLLRFGLAAQIKKQRSSTPLGGLLLPWTTSPSLTVKKHTSHQVNEKVFLPEWDWWSLSLWVDVRMFHSVLAASVKVTFYTSSLQLCLPSAVLLMMGCAAGCREPRMSWTGWAGPAPQRPPTPGPRGTTPPAKVSRLCAATSFMSGCIDRHYYSWASSSSITRSDHRWEMIAANRSSKNTVIVSHRSQSEIKLSLSLSILSLTTHHAAVSSDEVRSFKPFQRKRFLNSNVWKQDRSLAWWSELFFSFPGKYLHIKSSHPSLKGSRAQLKSAVLPPAGKDGYCFTLWYHMFGATVGDLKIFLRTVDTLEEELVPFFFIY